MNNRKSTITRRELMRQSAAGGLALLASPVLSLAQGQAAGATGGPSRFDDLAALLRGELIRPGDAGYDEARRVWNAMIDKHPAAIARCSGAADVMAVVNYARENHVPVSVRGGGHNVAGKALRNDAITIDLGPMHGIWVDAENKRAVAQGGARWGAFDRETVALGLATTGGTVSTTGVGGLTLGGGMGWLMREYGLSCDNLASAQVVTADGQMLTANATENPDLFWAIRGGGGNFGVVTSFEFRLHELHPIYGGLAMYPGSTLKDLFRFFRDFTATAPDSVTAMCGVFSGPPGTPVEGQNAGFIAVCHHGPLSEGEQLLKPIKEFGPPAVDSIGPMPYGALQTMFDAGSRGGARHYWRSNFMRELSDEAIDVLLAHSEGWPSPGVMILVENLGGAVGRVGEHETAFANRGALYNASIFGTWLDPAGDEKNVQWVKSFGDELRAFATGGAYVNYMAGDESPERVRAAYEANFQRLVEVKRKYDPDNFFSGNQNIAP